jgi:predicted nucleic acid-binding protein
MASPPRITLDANVFVASVVAGEQFADECREIIRRVASEYTLCEPSVVYVEVLGALGRRVSGALAERVSVELGGLLDLYPVVTCDRDFCLRAYPLCRRFGVYSVDSLYLGAAIESGATLVSLDRRDFVDRVNRHNPPVRVVHVSDFL